MPVPTYDQFIEPLLKFLFGVPNGVPAKEAHEAVSVSLGLTETDKQELLESGSQLVYKNRAGWAHDRLKRAGLSSSPRRGIWRLTEQGIEFAKSNASPFSKELIENLAMGYVTVKLRQTQPGTTQTVSPTQPQPTKINTIAATESPDDRLNVAILEIRQKIESELMELIIGVSPNYFEIIVLDLLHKMGYGETRADLQKVGGTGDSGIDGIISMDKLGLEKIYVQAKRWTSSVGRPEIQGFFGALAGQKAKKGIFITTSSYTQQATDYAKSVEGLVLIDGARLAKLMIENELGVSIKHIKIPKIDGDYFDEDLS